MRIVRGTFRLSIVIALAVVIYGGIDAHMKSSADQAETTRIWSTLRCGKRFLGTDMSRYTNEYGNIDIGRAGCASSQFLARFDEIESALKQDAPEPRYVVAFKRELVEWGLLGALSFVVVNIGGVLLVVARRVIRWIVAGYST